VEAHGKPGNPGRTLVFVAIVIIQYCIVVLVVPAIYCVLGLFLLFYFCLKQIMSRSRVAVLLWFTCWTSCTINEDEEGRMICALRKRRCVNLPATINGNYDSKFCQFSDTEAIDVLRTQPTNIVGLIGPKGTGKSQYLKHLASQQQERSIYIEVPEFTNFNLSLSDRIYDVLRDEIFVLPFPLNLMQFFAKGGTKSERLLRVLKKVAKEDGKVSLFVDFSEQCETRYPFMDWHERCLSSLLGNVLGTRYPSEGVFRASMFTRETKALVDDKDLVRCIFASSQVSAFELEARREPRLSLFQSANELSIDDATVYILKKYGILSSHSTRELLRRIPRTFANLNKFSICKDQDDFARKNISSQISRIISSVQDTSSWSGYHSGAMKLLKLALQRELREEDLQQYGGMKLEQFRAIFVETDILYRLANGGYDFKFEATKEAARNILR
jgi:energy-coupling factor transporter ATP-binding protein EcfA2